MVPPLLAAGSMCAKSVSSVPGSKLHVVPFSVPRTTLLTTRAVFRLVLQEAAATAASRMNQRVFISLLLLPLVAR